MEDFVGVSMKLPKTIKLGPFTFTVHRHQYQKDKENYFGWFKPSDQTFSIADDIHEEAQKETIAHELLHAAWWLAQLTQDKEVKEHEEKIVAMLSIPLMGIYKDNPKLKEVLFD